MAYIFGLIIVALLFMALHYFTELTRSQKIIVAATFALFISGAIMYNSHAATQQTKVLEIAKKYEQGKTVVCNGVEVNATNFDLSIGTYTFIGKENTPHYSEMIRAETCK